MIGRQVGNYEIVRLLGSGGMGSVYEAVHPVIGLRVAIKVLHPHISANPSLVDRFFSEARIVAAIGHPHIVTVSDFGRMTDGGQYLVMELIEGESLRGRLRRVHVLAPADAASIAAEVADALAAAHGRSVVHRDIKPDNVFLAQRSGRDFVKVLDFGIAKLMAEAGPPTVRTETGVHVGTPKYMSPEQCAGLPIDPRSDVYGLGVVLYEMVTGEAPFDDSAVGLLFMKHMQVPPRPPRSVVPSLPEELDAVILRALAKRPEARFASAAEMRDELVRLVPSLPRQVDGTGRSRRTTPRTQVDSIRDTTRTDAASEIRSTPKRPPRRRGAMAGVVAAVALLVSVGGIWLGRRAPRRTPDAASRAPAKPPAAAEPRAPTREAPPPAMTEVTLATRPAGAHVLVGDAVLGTTPLRWRFADGVHDVRFALEGYREQTRSVRVPEDREVSLDLVPRTRRSDPVRPEPGRSTIREPTAPAVAPRQDPDGLVVDLPPPKKKP